MKAKVLLMTAILSIACVAVLSAADASGKWLAQVPGRGGNMNETTFNFKVEGEKLTGTMSAGQGGEAQITDGKVKGDDISFTVVRSFQGNEVKLLFKGKVAGDEIKFTRSREGADQSQEFTAKRAK